MIVPYRHQLNSATCVPTCIGMLMASYNHEIEQGEIDKVLFALGKGIYGNHKAAIQALNYFGFDSATMAYIKGDYPIAFTFLNSVSKTSPIIVTGKFHHYPELNANSGHAVIVTMVDEVNEQIFYHDPHHVKASLNIGKNMQMNAHDFINKWAVQHKGWAVWIGGKNAK